MLAASANELPVQELNRRAASAVFPSRLVTSEGLGKLVGQAEPLTDAAPMATPCGGVGLNVIQGAAIPAMFAAVFWMPATRAEMERGVSVCVNAQ